MKYSYPVTRNEKYHVWHGQCLQERLYDCCWLGPFDGSVWEAVHDWGKRPLWWRLSLSVGSTSRKYPQGQRSEIRWCIGQFSPPAGGLKEQLLYTTLRCSFRWCSQGCLKLAASSALALLTQLGLCLWLLTRLSHLQILLWFGAMNSSEGEARIKERTQHRVRMEKVKLCVLQYSNRSESP